MNKDYYKTLNINRNSSQDEIKKAFRSLSKKHHPDKGGDESVFKEMSEAYDTLSDENKRREYDMRGQNPFGNPHNHRGPNMDDIFNQFFSNGGRGQQRQVRKGRSLNIPLRVTLDEVFHSTVKKLKYNKNINCGVCNGSKGTTQNCPTCKGAGFVQVAMGNAFFRQIQKQQCTTCSGIGQLIITPCDSCRGKGSEVMESTVDFKVPSDLMTGQLYTFKGLGDEIMNGSPGDLTIEVVIDRHPHFKVLGSDLIYEPYIALLDMVLGCDIKVPYFDTELSAKIPERSKPTANFTLRGKGLNSKQTGGYGNLVITPIVVMPSGLDKADRANLEEMREKNNFKIN